MFTSESIGMFIGMFITLFMLVGIPMLGLLWSIRANERAVTRRDQMLKKVFGEHVKIDRGFPIPEVIERIIQGGLRYTLQQFREIIVDENKWLFVQPTHLKTSKLTKGEDRGIATHSLFARHLLHESPTFLIRNKANPSFISRHLQIQITNRQFVPSELQFDNDQGLYIEQGHHIEALQLMSPELLITLGNAPFNADIIIRKNQLYYMLAGEKPAELVLKQLIAHSEAVARELNDNLEKWAQSSANQAAVDRVQNTTLATTLAEKWREAGE